MSRSKKAAQKPAVVRINTTQEFREMLYHFGPNISPHAASQIAGVSNQRIQNLIREGKFTRLIVFGAVYISFLEFEKWVFSPRKRGRPSKTTQTTDCDNPQPGKEKGYQPPTFSDHQRAA